ncbi:MAG TPA: iron ABC transporter permease [Lachnoclostridium sp.]|jgi:iron complex transport system permease protein|uniref:FecCD family ABC transporter permease n=1 Tax=Lacrimispora sp. TaxID=2719234 RepID=UPI000EDAA0EA|nr:iron ABC transporter permease [Lacrimispora sp.]HCD45867.1 iron ABC transporter permease [Lachnoclostridium sp.]
MTQKKQIFTKRKTMVRNTVVIGTCLALLILSGLISLSTGYSRLSPTDLLHAMMGGGREKENLILFSFRLPRIVLSMLVGAGLAVSGCLLQGVTKNPLADPGLLGIHSGAGLMVVLYVLFVGPLSPFSIFTLPVLALFGAGGAAVLVYFLSCKKGAGTAPVSMVMTGIAIQAGLSALTTLLVVKLDDTQYAFVSSWQTGSIWGANWTFVLALLPWLCILIPASLYKAGILDIMNLGDETAAGLGVSVNRERRKLLLMAAALAGACVSVSGSISFVGLMAPHITRRMVGPGHGIALPVCALVGALLVSAADTIARVIIQPASLPTGVVVSVIGAPYFIYLLSRREKETRR